MGTTEAELMARFQRIDGMDIDAATVAIKLDSVTGMGDHHDLSMHVWLKLSCWQQKNVAHVSCALCVLYVRALCVPLCLYVRVHLVVFVYVLRVRASASD